ncbi:putative RTA1-like protein [Mycena kentingensis (nom. inval.)]|nr:putative RTA1-like protein [Mycena kentingensis (nom. inval.)]
MFTALPSPSPSTVALPFPYHYVPTGWICASFVVLFTLSGGAHISQAFRHHTLWLLPTAVFCAVLEIVGWGARLWSSFDPHILLPFKIQIIGTIIGPTPLIAADFIILGRIIQRLGTRYSRLSPRLYSIIFVSCDIPSLFVQAVGATTASVEVGREEDPRHGGNIMLIGISFQMAVLTVYILLASEFMIRYFLDAPVRSDAVRYHTISTNGRGRLTPKLRTLLGALGYNTTCLLIRAIYRTLELKDGFAGRIISTERLFNILDGAMIVFAIVTLNVVHPGTYLAVDDGEAAREETEVEMRLKEAGLWYHRF